MDLIVFNGVLLNNFNCLYSIPHMESIAIALIRIQYCMYGTHIHMVMTSLRLYEHIGFTCMK